MTIRDHADPSTVLGILQLIQSLEKELEKKISQRYFKYDQKMLEYRMKMKETLRISEILSRFQRTRPDVFRKLHEDSEHILRVVLLSEVGILDIIR
jgi:hypothetical protein